MFKATSNKNFPAVQTNTLGYNMQKIDH